MIIILILASIFRGPGKTPSVIGVIRCAPADHAILACLILSGILLTILGSVWNNSDYKKKISLGYKMVKGDF